MVVIKNIIAYRKKLSSWYTNTLTSIDVDIP